MSGARRAAAGGLGAAAVLLIGPAAHAADVGANADPFAPTRPVGIASALPRSPLADIVVFGTERFPSAAAAQRRCPGDVVVSVDTLSNVAHPARPRGPGVFMCKSSALSEGDLPR